MPSLTSASFFLLPLVANASPLLNSKALDALFCKANDVALKAVMKNAVATPYCVSFLNVPTSTITQTATVTPSSVYTTLPATITTDAATTTVAETTTIQVDESTTVIDTHTEYSTTTLTTSTATLTCLNSAYTYAAPTGVVPAPNTQEITKRGREVEKPKQLPNEWTAPQISKACSCLVLPTPEVTTTVTTTLPAETLTTYTTNVIVPTVTTTATEVDSTTVVHPTTIKQTVTETVTAYATETTIASNGVRYKKQSHSYNANLFNSGFDSRFFKTASTEFSGVLTSLSFTTPNWPSGSTYLQLADRQDAFRSDQSALVMQGFYIAKQTGTHTFVSTGDGVDNWAYMWVGDAAYSAWDDSNTAFKSSRTGAPYVTGSYEIHMNAGDAVPVTYLWANGGGVGRSLLEITTPDGNAMMEHDGYFVQACSSSVFA